MHFLNPIALVGLAATLIPLAIHLLYRARTRPLPFSNLKFLRDLHHRRLRRLRLRQWLILLLRILALALLALAFARPAYRAGGGALGSSVPTAAVVLLDRSFSTTYRAPEGRLFDQLRARAAELLEIFTARDEVLLVPFAARATPMEGTPAYLREELAGLMPSEEATNLNLALKAAADYLAARADMNQEVFLFSDLARYNWPQVGERRQWLPRATVYIDAIDQSERANLYIDAVHLDPWLPAPGKKFALQVELGYSAPRPAPGTSVDLYIEGERVRRREVDLVPGARTQIDFSIVPRRAGHLRGYVEVEDDALPLDNRRYFTLHIPALVQVLLVGAQPDDTYYARRALSAGALADPTLNARSVLAPDLDAEELEETQVVVLCQVARLSAEQTALLRRFVARGGGLILFPSPRADLNFYNRHLLPGLVPVVFKGALGRPGDQGGLQRLDRKRRHHPLFEGLLTEVPADQPRFFAFFELVPQQPLQPLIFFGDGRPALLEGWKERGRTLIFAAPLDLQWSDLALKGLFAPLLQRLVRHLVLPPDAGTGYRVGQSVYRYLDAVALDSGIQAEAPSGRRLLIEPELVGKRYFWKVPRVDESGLWRLRRGREVVDRFAVNLDTRESVPAPVERDYLLRLFGEHRTHFIEAGDELRGKVLGNRYGRELWRECLVLALLILMLELWLARAPRREIGERRAA